MSFRYYQQYTPYINIAEIRPRRDPKAGDAKESNTVKAGEEKESEAKKTKKRKKGKKKKKGTDNEEDSRYTNYTYDVGGREKLRNNYTKYREWGKYCSL